MTHRIKSLLVAALLSLTAGHSTVAHSQHFGAGAPPAPGPGRGGPSPQPGGPSGGPPGGPIGPGGMSGGERLPGAGFSRDRVPPPVSGMGRDGFPESPSDVTRVVPLGDVVSMVQGHFNATAVKTDTVNDGGRVMYRIRLLSADRSRVWTVNVDAQTGQMN